MSHQQGFNGQQQYGGMMQQQQQQHHRAGSNNTFGMNSGMMPGMNNQQGMGPMMPGTTGINNFQPNGVNNKIAPMQVSSKSIWSNVFFSLHMNGLSHRIRTDRLRWA